MDDLGRAPGERRLGLVVAAYWLSAAVWLVYGLKRRDPNLYLPCIGWLLLDGAVVVGVLVVG